MFPTHLEDVCFHGIFFLLKEKMGEGSAKYPLIFISLIFVLVEFASYEFSKKLSGKIEFFLCDFEEVLSWVFGEMLLGFIQQIFLSCSIL